jgi:hypothetical protein
MPTLDFPLGPPTKLSIKVDSFTPLKRNTLCGFLTATVAKVGIRLNDMPVHESNGRRWCSLPAKPQLNKDGVALRDGRGKLQYAPTVQFVCREIGDAFSNRVIAALLETHPHAFDDMETAR